MRIGYKIMRGMGFMRFILVIFFKAYVSDDHNLGRERFLAGIPEQYKRRKEGKKHRRRVFETEWILYRKQVPPTVNALRESYYT